MSNAVEFLDLFGVDKELLYTSDGRAIALIEDNPEKTVYARVFIKDGHIRLSVGDALDVRDDFKVTVRH